MSEWHIAMSGNEIFKGNMTWCDCAAWAELKAYIKVWDSAVGASGHKQWNEVEFIPKV